MTKFMLKAVVLFAVFEAVVAHAQTYKAPPHFNHIVIIFQENRTPDNLFGATPMTSPCGTEDPFETGVDIQGGGPNLSSKQNGGPSVTCLTALSIPNGGDDHSHDPAWTRQYNLGAMDGACLRTGWPNCPQYVYVPKPEVKPYFDIATSYGFANYMFQTQQGPSFEAHQFILGGTSAPVWPGDVNNYFQDFVAENASFYDSGCPVGSHGPTWVNPGNQELADPNKSECYDRNTLVTYQDSSFLVHDKGVSWKYYTPLKGIIWDAPEANPQICYSASGPPPGNPACSGTEWGHVSLPNANTSAPVLSDILNCQLPAISWVIPDEAWSDHPGGKDKSLGPSWVADIVDAIGNATTCDNGAGYWSDTAIFITWDDWGGFYDHVPPPADYVGHQSGQQWMCGSGDAPNGWGCGYVYGFRVPLLVVSQYTPPLTVSGAISGPPTYPPPKDWTHDFGSILKFTENNFFGATAKIAPANYTYADSNTLDTHGGLYTPLWEFFLGSPRNFTSIAPTNPAYDANYFINYYLTTQNGVYPQPTGPEDGDPND
ncbi:MAG TPA: alkaline phosphatase family protein [Terriglobales bacterium]|nr:alkaline phosphatase family protein [Terriglobales bacterium]